MSELHLAPPIDIPTEPDLTDFAVHTKHRGMAVRMAKEHHNKLIYVPNLGWHAWDTRRWVPDTDDIKAGAAVGETVRKAWGEAAYLNKDDRKTFVRDIELSETEPGTRGTLALTRALPGMSVNATDLDADPFLLNVANGTLDLRTMRLSKPRPTDYLTKITTGAYDAEAAAPRWVAFLESSIPDADIREYLARLFGYGLLGLVREHVMPIFTGTGHNGKTTLVEAIANAFGDYHLTVDPSMLLSADKNRGSGAASPDIVQLRGARVVTMTETKQGVDLDTAKVKSLTGGDTISARPLFKESITFRPSHLPVMVTNHLPDVPADDPALWRRLAVIPFDVVIPASARDRKLKERLEDEADGILSWAIAGWAEYQTAGDLAPPDAVNLRTAAYQQESDHVSMWVTDCIEIDPHNTYIRESNENLWQSWTAWARNTRKPTGRRPDLLAALEKIDGVTGTRVQSVRSMSGVKIING